MAGFPKTDDFVALMRPRAMSLAEDGLLDVDRSTQKVQSFKVSYQSHRLVNNAKLRKMQHRSSSKSCLICW